MIGIVQDVFSFFALNSFASGILIGVLGTFVYALILARIRPKMKFAKYISKRRVSTSEALSGVKYLFEFWNAGWRDIIDIEISARLVIRGMALKYPRNFTFYAIPPGYDTLPRVKRWSINEQLLKLLILMRLIKRSQQQQKLRKEPLKHLTRLDVHAIQELQTSHYASFLYRKLQENESVRKEWERDQITASNLTEDSELLEHLLGLGNGPDVSYIEINISGYDSFSGTKRLFTKIYKCKDILIKDFFGNDLVIPKKPGKPGTDT